MPAAAPLPRYPSVLTLDGVSGLLTGPGCPVCRYVGEASDRYLTWFGLEGHSDAAAIHRLAGSLGMCARHTRRLMSQPGAAVRLTAVYQYILRAARETLAGRTAPVTACPMCEHAAAAASRALDTLLDGLDDEFVRLRCRELGGLCVPHLNAASTSGRRDTIAWLTETMTATLIRHSPPLEWLAGDTDHDSDMRAVLRRSMPVRSLPGSYVCAACLAGARAESACIIRVVHLSREGLPADHELLLCASHLADAATLAERGAPLALLLAWQASGHITTKVGRSGLSSRAKSPSALSRIRPSRRRSPECAACRTKGAASQRAIDEFRQILRDDQPPLGRLATLCVRHVLSLRAVDPWAAQMIVRGVVDRADMLLDELAEAFRKNTWAHRHEAGGAERTAWRRAAAFLDGTVFCGNPPHQP